MALAAEKFAYTTHEVHSRLFSKGKYARMAPGTQAPAGVRANPATQDTHTVQSFWLTLEQLEAAETEERCISLTLNKSIEIMLV